MDDDRVPNGRCEQRRECDHDQRCIDHEGSASKGRKLVPACCDRRNDNRGCSNDNAENGTEVVHAAGFTVDLNLDIRYGPDRTGAYFAVSPGARHEGRHAISASQFGW